MFSHVLFTIIVLFVQDNSGKLSGTFRSSPKPALRFAAETVTQPPPFIAVFIYC